MFEHFSLKRRVSELEEGLEKLQREHKSLGLEWQNTLDKLNQIVGRINKRAALSQEKEDALMGKDPALEESAAGGVPLSPKAALIQQQILQRRRMLNNGGK